MPESLADMFLKARSAVLHGGPTAPFSAVPGVKEDGAFALIYAGLEMLAKNARNYGGVEALKKQLLLEYGEGARKFWTD